MEYQIFKSLKSGHGSGSSIVSSISYKDKDNHIKELKKNIQNNNSNVYNNEDSTSNDDYLNKFDIDASSENTSFKNSDEYNMYTISFKNNKNEEINSIDENKNINSSIAENKNDHKNGHEKRSISHKKSKNLNKSKSSNKSLNKISGKQKSKSYTNSTKSLNKKNKSYTNSNTTLSNYTRKKYIKSNNLKNENKENINHSSLITEMDKGQSKHQNIHKFSNSNTEFPIPLDYNNDPLNENKQDNNIPITEKSMPSSQSIENINKIYEKFNEYNNDSNNTLFNSNKEVSYKVVNMSSESLPLSNSSLHHQSYNALVMHVGRRKNAKVEQRENIESDNIKYNRSLSIDNVKKKDVNKEFSKTYKSPKKDHIDDTIHTSRSFFNRNNTSNDYRKKMFYGSGKGGVNKGPIDNKMTKSSEILSERSLKSQSIYKNKNFSYDMTMDSIMGKYNTLCNYDKMITSQSGLMNKATDRNNSENDKDPLENNKEIQITKNSNNISNSYSNINKNSIKYCNKSKNKININGSLSLTRNSSSDDYYHYYIHQNHYHYINDSTKNRFNPLESPFINVSNFKQNIDGIVSGKENIKMKNYNPSLSQSFLITSQHQDLSGMHPLPPIKRLVLQQSIKDSKPIYTVKDKKIIPIHHHEIKAKVDDHNKLVSRKTIVTPVSSKGRQSKKDSTTKEINNQDSLSDSKNESSIDNISEMELKKDHLDMEQKIESPLRSLRNSIKQLSQEIYENIETENESDTNRNVAENKTKAETESDKNRIENVKENAEAQKELKIIQSYINKLDNKKVDDEYTFNTNIHHEIKRDRDFLNDFILLDQVESFKENNDVINDHVWSIDTFINNHNMQNVSKKEALDMLWNIYAILIVQSENNKPILKFETLEMIRGRLQQLINTKEDIQEKLLNLLPNIIKYIPREEIIKLRGILGHLHRIYHSFINDISNSLSIIFSPLIFTKLNNFIPFTDSIVQFMKKPLTHLESANGYEELQEKLKEQSIAMGCIIEKEEIKGTGKKRFYEIIFFESSPLNIGDFLLRNMIVYYRNLFIEKNM
ncbi:hypothetical protein BCR36DRAFT_331547 [Piromyces finnis]|uniref:Uncharacterized protein n=1 Tax=Piromyces finnis TaxID=1754191 RepID=A0A1Y1V450_9FUNG|nr:hypothetical protein BCR36DRAFT_331547 [Piromyces finnis]|eukprot:ORX46665.1 hypothetical protein BCR36DRAFT_331547 [Piromyces finnis]